MRAYIEGVRIKNDDFIVPCANKVQANQVIKQILARYPELEENDLEITEIVFPSIKHFLLLVLVMLISRVGG